MEARSHSAAGRMAETKPGPVRRATTEKTKMTTEITAEQMAAHRKSQEDCEQVRKRDAELLASIREKMPKTRDEFVAAQHAYLEAGGFHRLEVQFAAALLNTGTNPSMISQFVAILGYTEYDRYDPYYTEPACHWLGKRGELDSRPRFNPIPQGW